MTEIFDGKKFAADKEMKLKGQVDDMMINGIRPKLASIIVGDNPASVLYVNLKKKAAERIGAEIEMIKLMENANVEDVKTIIKDCNNRDLVHGIMVQLPLPQNLRQKTENILQTIAPGKDVDGLRADSRFVHPTVKAIFEILRFAINIVRLPLKTRSYTPKAVFVGSSGFVGKHFMKDARELNSSIYSVSGVNRKSDNLAETIRNADIVISATGIEGLIEADMIKKGAVLIDVGAPHGDIAKAAYAKAAFVSPVPGGVGPVTISCLMENLVDATSNVNQVQN